MFIEYNTFVYLLVAMSHRRRMLSWFRSPFCQLLPVSEWKMLNLNYVFEFVNSYVPSLCANSGSVPYTFTQHSYINKKIFLVLSWIELHERKPNHPCYPNKYLVVSSFSSDMWWRQWLHMVFQRRFYNSNRVVFMIKLWLRHWNNLSVNNNVITTDKGRTNASR